MVHQKLTKSHNSWFLWPVGQAVKTAASHAVNVGSIPARVTKICSPALAGAFFWCFRARNRTGRPPAGGKKQSCGLFFSPWEMDARVTKKHYFI